MIDWVEARLEWIDNQLGESTASTLLYYWYFDTDLQNDTPFETLESSYSIIDGGHIEYQSALPGYPFYPGHANWRKASMERRNRPTSLNYRPEGNNGALFDEADMRALQVRQPFTGDAGENTMIFHLPTVGYKDITMSFAAKDEGAADNLIIDYSIDMFDYEWETSGLPVNTYLLGDEYRLFKVDFSGIESVNNNPYLKVRIRFGGDDMTADDGNRVTFNNIALTSTSPLVSVSEDEEAIVHTSHLAQNYPNPFNVRGL